MAHDVERAARKVNHKPSDGQKEAGNYQKGHTSIHGLPISIENAKGSTRSGTGKDGKPWEVRNLPTHYGYVKRSEGADGDHVDVHIGPKPKSKMAWVIDQVDPDKGKFDEHKVMLGFHKKEHALDAYHGSFSDDRGPDRVGAVTPLSISKFKGWLKDGDTKKPYGKIRKYAKGGLVQAFEDGDEVEPVEDEWETVEAPAAPEEAPAAAEDDGWETVEAKPAEDDGWETVPTKAAAANEAVADDGWETVGEDDSSALGTFGRAAVQSVLPTVGGIGAAGVGSNIGGIIGTAAAPFLGPAAPIAPLAGRVLGGLAGGLAGAYATRGAQDYVAEVVGLKDDTQDAADSRAHPYAKLGGDLFPSVPFFGSAGAKVAERLLGGGLQGGIEAGQELAQGEFDPVKVAGAGAFGAWRAKPTAAGERLLGVGDKLIPGRPDVRPADPLNQEFKGDAVASEPSKVSTFTANEQPPPVENTTIGSDTGFREGSERQYNKEQLGLPEDLVSVGDVDPTIAHVFEVAKEAEPIAEPESPAGEFQGLPASTERFPGLPPSAKGLGFRGPVEEPAPTRPPRAQEAINRSLGAERSGDDVLRGPRMDEFEPASRYEDVGYHEEAPPPPEEPPHPGIPEYGPGEEPGAWRARKPANESERVAAYIDQQFQEVRKRDVDQRETTMKAAKELPKDVQDAFPRIYEARESGNLDTLSPRDREIYNTHEHRFVEESGRMADKIEELAPGLLGPKSNVYRIRKGANGDPLAEGLRNDPVTGAHGVNTSPKGTILDQKFFAIEGKNGKRSIVSVGEDGKPTRWDGYKATKMDAPRFEFEDGGKTLLGDQEYTMRHARTGEIERNVKGADGKPLQFHKNSMWSAVEGHSQLASILDHLQVLESLKKNPDVKPFMSNKISGKEAEAKGWKQTNLPQFKDYWMDPQLKYVMDDFNKPGYNSDALNWVRRISSAVTKTIFMIPVAHTLNEGTHFWTARGWDWVTPKGTRSLVVNGAKAIKSVIAQDKLQSDIRRVGGSTMSDNLDVANFHSTLGKAFGEAVKREPFKWDPIAKALGYGPSDLIRAVYDGSSRVMWTSHDMFLTQLVLEQMDKGKTLRAAVNHAEKHLPNYRVGATLLSSSEGGRFLSQTMQESTIFSFGRYHSGMANSWANIVKDLVKGKTGQERFESVGNLMAMGLLAFAVYPALDKLYKSVSGNNQAEAHRRGPLAIPDKLVKAYKGETDIMDAARSTVTVSPLASTALETLANKDWRGKDIVQKGELGRGARGIGRAAVQEGEHLAKGLVSPIGKFGNAMNKGESPIKPVLEELADMRNPSNASNRYMAQIKKHNMQDRMQRFRKPPGMLERVYNKIVGSR